MSRASGRFTSALCTSIALHSVGAVVFWRLHAWRIADVAALAPAAPFPRSGEQAGSSAPVSIAVLSAMDAPVPIGVQESGAAAPLPGDLDRRVASATAPSTAPNPDRFADQAAASSGQGRGVRELPVTGRRDDEQMRVQPHNADQGYQLQRIRTDRDRVSREDVRATPHPGFAAELASRRGDGRARSRPGGRSLGALAGAVASAARTGMLPSGSSEDWRLARALAMEARGRFRIGQDGEEEAGFVRPLIAAGPASIDGGQRSERVADRSDAAAVSSDLRPGRIELSHPGVLGVDASGRGRGDRPAWARVGRGGEAVPVGDPSAPPGEDLVLATYRRHYNEYLAQVKRQVDPLWEFPRDLAIKLEQGDVLVSFTIRSDGTVKEVRVLKPSGFPRFDQNVVGAIRRAAPYGPLPSVFGAELRVTAPFAGDNPVVR